MLKRLLNELYQLQRWLQKWRARHETGEPNNGLSRTVAHLLRIEIQNLYR